MNWIKQNKFLAGFLAFMVIGVGALGYLLYSAHARYTAAQDTYASKILELKRLESLKPYPENSNLKQFDEQKKEYAASLQGLRADLSAQQLPLEAVTEIQFQDRLRETVTRLAALAKGKGILGLVEKNAYLDFDRYQNAPPKPEAAPVLARQLKAMELILSKIIEEGVTSIDKIERTPLLEEEGRKEPKDAAGKGKGAGKGDAPGKELVATHAITVDFTTDQLRFRKILNSIVATKEQFIIPRLVLVKNQAEAAPSRISAAVGGPPVDAPPPDPNAPKSNVPTAENLKYVFGAEKLAVSLRLDIVDFAEAAPSAPKAAKAK